MILTHVGGSKMSDDRVPKWVLFIWRKYSELKRTWWSGGKCEAEIRRGGGGEKNKEEEGRILQQRALLNLYFASKKKKNRWLTVTNGTSLVSKCTLQYPLWKPSHSTHTLTKGKNCFRKEVLGDTDSISFSTCNSHKYIYILQLIEGSSLHNAD